MSRTELLVPNSPRFWPVLHRARILTLRQSLHTKRPHSQPLTIRPSIENKLTPLIWLDLKFQRQNLNAIQTKWKPNATYRTYLNIQMTWTNYCSSPARLFVSLSLSYAPSFANFHQLYVNDRLFLFSHHIRSIINPLARLKIYEVRPLVRGCAVALTAIEC